MEEIEEPVPVVDVNTLMRSVIPELAINSKLIFLGLSRWPVADTKISKQGYLQKFQFLYGDPLLKPQITEYYVDNANLRLVHTGVGSGYPVLNIKELNKTVSEMLGFEFD